MKMVEGVYALEEIAGQAAYDMEKGFLRQYTVLGIVLGGLAGLVGFLGFKEPWLLLFLIPIGGAAWKTHALWADSRQMLKKLETEARFWKLANQLGHLVDPPL